MDYFVLRRNPAWRMPPDWQKPLASQILAHFQTIAKAHGSSAVWLPLSGSLITREKTEVKRNFPYEEWQQMARSQTTKA